MVTLADSQGEKPAELPVQQSIKIKLILNRNTAKTLGLAAPITLPGRPDEGHRITVAFVAVHESGSGPIADIQQQAPENVGLLGKSRHQNKKASLLLVDP